jgi:hypothetical protein
MEQFVCEFNKLGIHDLTKDFEHTFMAQCCLSVNDSDRFPGG